MESLPDDVLHKILKIGTDAKRLNHVDLCSLAAVNRHFDQLTRDPTLWAALVSRDFPFVRLRFFQDPSKALYREVHEQSRLVVHREGFFWGKGEFERQIKQYEEQIERLKRRIKQLYEEQIEPPSRVVDVDEPENYSARIFQVSQLLSHASQYSLRQAHNRHYENRSSKSFDKVSMPKGIPNSKSYIPMNRPPRRSMPRKI